jgi:hypothetical protein
MKFVADPPTSAAEPSGSACVIVIRSIEDKRDSASSFGSSANFEQFALHVPEWVRTAVASLDRPTRKLVFAEGGSGSTEPESVVVTVKIYKAYVQGMATSRTSQVVLSNQYERGGTVLGTAYYRGSDTSVNWASSADEAEAGMNAAMNVALVGMSKDFDKYCVTAPSRK